jgi:hypothetical protein
MEDPLLHSAKREALAALVVWLVALIYSVAVCFTLGSNRAPDQLTYVLGFPDWIFWGVVLPWFVCLAISAWFAFFFMQDHPLGEDESEETPDA